MIETRISYINLLEEGLVRVELKPNVELRSEDLDENFRQYKALLKGKPALFLVVFSDFGKSDAATRDKFADPQRSELKKAEALVVKQLSQRMESNFYINYQKPNHPVKIFNREEEAIRWLRKFKD